VPLAHASPTDSPWIPGIYDGADFDEAIEAVLSASGVVGASVVPGMLAKPRGSAIGSGEPVSVSSASLSLLPIRSPPTPA